MKCSVTCSLFVDIIMLILLSLTPYKRQTLALECHCIKANLDIHINIHIANLSLRLAV